MDAERKGSKRLDRDSRVYGSVHRGSGQESKITTQKYEQSRETIRTVKKQPEGSPTPLGVPSSPLATGVGDETVQTILPDGQALS